MNNLSSSGGNALSNEQLKYAKDEYFFSLFNSNIIPSFLANIVAICNFVVVVEVGELKLL